MLKLGTFITDSEQYTIYEQTSTGFSRFDICEAGAAFHMQPDRVVFSVVKQRGTFVYGNNALYQEYNQLLNLAHQIQVPGETENKWVGGAYHSVSTRSQESSQFLEETVMINGKFYSYTLQLGDKTITSEVLSGYSDSKLRPINFEDYTKLELDASEVHSDGAPYYSLSVLRARYDISHLDKCDYVVADSPEVARERLQRWVEADVPLKGIDTETTGTDIDLYGEDKMVGIILSCSETESTYYPFGHTQFDNLSEEFLQKELMPAIKKEEYRLVSHNKKFERKVFLHLGWSIYIKYDTLPLSFMVNPVIERGAHALKDLMFRATGKTFLELDNIFVSPKMIDFSVLPKEIVRLYACPDASSLLFLFPYLWEQLPAYSRSITEVEFALADVKADQEYYGMRVDVEKFMKNLENCDYTLDLLLRAFRAITKTDGNVNSPEVLSDLIFGKMACPVLVRTKTGKPSTGAASIKKLASIKADTQREQVITGDLCDLFGKPVVKAKDLNSAKYPALVILEKYRIYNKLRTAFYSRFERTKRSGRVFFWVNQNGATSGRQSSPMHQLPPELKDIIIPDSDEHDMWDPDYSQIELRMIAFLAGEKELIELCKDPENDIHRAIGSLISNKEMWEISSEERKIGKRRNFGVVYMISPYGLAAQIAGAGYSAKDVEVAEKSLNDFYLRFKRIKRYIAMNAEKVKSQGYITTFFGRNKYFKEIFDPEITSRRKSSILRQANNLPVQGTAADYLKLAETNYSAYIRNKGWDELMENGFPRVRVALSIHDEVLLMADRSIPYEEIILMIRTCMEMPIEGAPPFFCAPALVHTWAQHDDDSVAMPVKLRDALIEDYQKTGVSRLNKENYLSVLNDYREKVLHDYMRDLIQKYGRDAEVVSQHVRHPSLTHELIARYPAPRDLDLDHVGCIRYATEQYIKGEIAAVVESKEEVEHLDDLSELQVLVNFDDNGNVVYDTQSDEGEEEFTDFYVDERFVQDIADNEKVYVWELMDAICIDITDLSNEAANKVIQKVWMNKAEDGFFRVLFTYSDRMLDAGFRVEDLDKLALTEYIKEVKSDDSKTG